MWPAAVCGNVHAARSWSLSSGFSTATRSGHSHEVTWCACALPLIHKRLSPCQSPFSSACPRGCHDDKVSSETVSKTILILKFSLKPMTNALHVLQNHHRSWTVGCLVLHCCCRLLWLNLRLKPVGRWMGTHASAIVSSIAEKMSDEIFF